ncbi:TraB/GumN family protein [Brevundimonas sp.]|uniref:TraB/GumN family protein n=1 Tax=Brevundimonas sp. TaxID=1871086 RepID=UPI002D404B54|nr:TraB/GumN family protein [Brevundimonas sp.]HYD28156.1 TraB/GumN family protein [Brevundimonas sp.]
MNALPAPRRLAGAFRSALGATLGLGMAAALVFQPAEAFALPAAPSAALASAPVQASGAGGPALWVIRDEDSTLYLFGTVHVLRPATLWRWAPVESAFDSADRLVLEISNPDDQAAMMPLIQQHGLSPDRPLSSLLNAEERSRLDAAAQTMGASGAALDPMRPWLAALTLSVAPLVKAGYDPQSGVEIALKARAAAAGKEVGGFETIDEQIRILAGFSEDDQLSFLRSTLEDFETATTDLDRLVEAWSTGDVRAIDRLGVQPMRRSDRSVYEALLVKRNANWADQIQTMLDGSGTVFIAVGAAHLAGGDSVQSILDRRGVEVERIN